MSTNPTFVNDMNIFGKHVKQIPCIVGEGSPTSDTYGAVGMLYMDTSSNGGGEMWKCIGVEGTSYTWEKLVDIAAMEATLAEMLAERAQLRPEPAESLEWLEANGDTDKIYVLPDGYLYMWMLTEKEVTTETEGGGYTNLLPLATDDDRVTVLNGIGYILGKRLSTSSGIAISNDISGVSGYIPAVENDTLRFENCPPLTSVNSYIFAYDSSNTRVGYVALGINSEDSEPGTPAKWSNEYYNSETGILTIKLTSALFGTGFNAIRFNACFTQDSIVTINEEIVDSSIDTETTIIKEYAWANTGHAFVPADYEDRIIAAEEQITKNTTAIAALKNGSVDTEDVDALTWIRNWDSPIYDANIPVFLLDAEKAAMTSTVNTPDSIYAMYDALMEQHPQYITKTDLGLCSDGTNHVYRYDFCEPEPYHQSNMPWSETKIKGILVSGIHFEWAGIYCLYYALEELANNPKLAHLRRNTHFIVVPVLNPYCTVTANYNASMGVLNANGVQIHRNFEVGFIYPGESGYQEFGTRNHGGVAPLSEMETQSLDNIFKENTDAAFFLTCHNFDAPSATNGIGFIWPSTATKYMCNMGYRLIDKMSIAWMDKYSEELAAGIADYRTDNVSDYFLRFGHAHVSLTDGTETRQATKYGIQGANIEVCHRFYPHGTKDNVEPALSEFTLSRGAETYINFLLTACGCYDWKDKKLYAPTEV